MIVPTKGRAVPNMKMVGDQAQSFEVARFREGHHARYLRNKGAPGYVEDITHEACRQESGMFEIDDVHLIGVGDEKVVRCDISVTEA
jgi:hypothetical protein